MTPNESAALIRAGRGQSSLPASLKGRLGHQLSEATSATKDRPGLLDDAARLAEAGRRGDKVIAHITPEEAALLKARGGSGTVNPRTGLLEFFEGSDQADSHGSNSSGMVGGDPSGGAPGGNMGGGSVTTPGEQLADALARGDKVDFSAPMADGGRDEGDRGRAAGRAGGIGGFNDSRGLLDRVGDFFSTKINDARANPIATAINMGFGMVPGVGTINTVSGLLGGRTVGDITTAAARGMTGFEATPTSAPSTPTAPDGFASDSRGGGDHGAPAPQAYAPAPQRTAEQIAQQALRQAIIQPPQAFNTWLGNKMQIPQNPGTPRAFNWWDGNQFRMPSGLLG